MFINLQQIQTLWYGGIKPGRKEKVKTVLQHLGLNATFVPPFISDDKINAVRIGCGKSHVKALKQSLGQPTLILEDDINKTEWYKSEFEIPYDADAVYLGTCLNGLHPQWQTRHPNAACCADPIMLRRLKDVYQITGMLTTHAILYVSDLYKQECIKLIEQDDGKNHCDVLMAGNMDKYKVYAFKFPMFYQDCLQDNKDAYEKTITPLWSVFR